PPGARPLADRMRPASIGEFVGQAHLLGADKPLRRLIESGRAHSMVLWGPPGTGKTTLARLVAAHGRAQFLTLSAVLAGVKDIRAAVERARTYRAERGGDTILFVDEVHRFNKSQQDAFLPYVEDGTVIFIGATTENPAFEVNGALLSRARVYVLRALEAADIRALVDRALADAERGVAASGISMGEAARDMLAAAADGDARRALNLLEVAAALVEERGTSEIDEALLATVLAGGGSRRFDKGGDAFYDQISALHKSVRGSAPDAALYWLARMLDGGCDPRYIARRIVRIASEDVGTADPRALGIALDAWDVQERLGSPEGELALAQAAVYLACAPKSDAVYKAFGAAMSDVREHGSLEVPLHLRNAPTRLAAGLGHGREYRYAHDEPDAYAAGERYLPEALGERRYYSPSDRGLEARIAEKLAHWRELDLAHARKRDADE
ncbi:MAG: replication-associated recombination protein A, partial [Gammaproteobacteria bacterium]|nr:replication-associated recombination protein A [Gammaproteobacteria bacterium]